MSIETYQQALDFWHKRVNYEQRGMPSDLRELKLDRMRSLLRRLGNPERGLPIVHIAGSKGKGSVAAMLSAVLQAAGMRTGLFTSPHLIRVEERVQIDGQPIDPDDLTRLMRIIADVVPDIEDEQGSQPTFFEIVTALGFLYFAQKKADLAVIEVGLGGRFDSTNVCDPLVSVITSISFDHTQQLGNTLVAIAGEKAGIIKPGRPVVSGETKPEPAEVIATHAAMQGSPLRVLKRDFDVEYRPGSVSGSDPQLPGMRFQSAHRHWPWMELGLLGRHQAANAAVVVAVVEELVRHGYAISDDAVAHGLRNVRWPARVEVVSQRPWVIVDCAHNVASCEALVSTLAESLPPLPWTLLFAASRDKDLPGMMRVLAPHFQTAIFTRYRSSQRGADPELLLSLWRDAGGRNGQIVESPTEAYHRIRGDLRNDELLCVTGSVFLAGEILAEIRAEPGGGDTVPENPRGPAAPPTPEPGVGASDEVRQ
ncbi:MAG: bifunctional folylpolyglutamate synthase/dihydrofolate synthase [Gemmatales bacterium]|nr:bifunctional folylpolyglutamate synthase/dihydrofolate synthase [Gemmatales bacterium]MDW8387338.1 folylpolyglutamate synthase/dihydrofolate synthase family protein [Gemmatales bacterium]